MAGISDLGTGIGYVYLTKPDGTTILSNIPNTPNNLGNIKVLAVKAASLSGNKSAVGLINITVAPTGVGSINDIKINAVSQIASSVAYTGSTTVSDLASDLADAINAYTPTSGANYSAVAVLGQVFLIAPASSGSTVSGHAVSVSLGANPPTVSTTAVAGGVSAGENYDTLAGYRFFLNTDSDAEPGDLTGADEITDYLISKGLASNITIQTATISNNTLTFERLGWINYVVIDTEGAAATDELDYIYPSSTFSNGDIVVLVGANSGRVTTINGTKTGNIDIDMTWSSANKNTTIWLYYLNGEFQESTRSGGNYVAAASAFRTAGFPFLTSSAYGKQSYTVANNTTVTITPNSTKQFLYFTGTASLTTGNYDVVFDTTGAKAGDWFVADWSAQVTIGSYEVNIGGYQVSDDEALHGSIVVFAYYDGSAWNYVTWHKTGRDTMSGLEILQNSITLNRLETALSYELANFHVSFENNEQGDNKIKMPYAGSIVEIYAIAQKAIAGTDSGTITPKNNAGTTMTGGVITFAASDPVNTAYTSTPSGNNTFSAGDILSFTTAKTTAGGRVLLSIKIQRS